VCPLISELAGTDGDGYGSSGPERRRRWASSEKARIVEESLRPGAAVTAVAQRHDVHPNLLHHWRRQAKRALVGGQGLKFLPVAVTPAARPKAEGSIEIELAGSVRVRVDAAVDEAALGRVLRALGAVGR
jgi:transposase